MLTIIKQLQAQTDIHSTKILDLFLEIFQIEKIVINIFMIIFSLNIFKV